MTSILYIFIPMPFYIYMYIYIEPHARLMAAPTSLLHPEFQHTGSPIQQIDQHLWSTYMGSYRQHPLK
jgi:hypothetical protein